MQTGEKMTITQEHGETGRDRLGVASVIADRPCGTRFPHMAFRSIPRFGLALALLMAPALIPEASAQSGKERLAADLTINAAAYFKDSTVIPETDKPRTGKCLADSMVADIPEPDAGKLADIFEKRSPSDPALAKKWLTIRQADAPARHAQVLAQVKKRCPELGPYLEPAM